MISENIKPFTELDDLYSDNAEEYIIVLEAIIEDIALATQEIEEALAQKDTKEITSIRHKLLGIVATVQMQDFIDVLRETRLLNVEDEEEVRKALLSIKEKSKRILDLLKQKNQSVRATMM